MFEHRILPLTAEDWLSAPASQTFTDRSISVVLQAKA